jgi:flagellar hook protein FlgE
MMRSMFAGVVGLRSHQFRMDVIGNNVANINTTGFKGSRVTFQDIFSQTIRGASGPTGDFGGTNAQQIGLGVGIATVDLVTTPGSLQLTGRDTDMAIEGNGLFILRAGGQLFYSRAGAFDRDAQGFLVNPASGLRVQGWMARPDGTFDIKDQSTLTDLRIPVGDVIQPQATANILFGNSLNALTPNDSVHTTAVQVFDTLGRMHLIKMKFQKVDFNTWDIGVLDPTGNGVDEYLDIVQEEGDLGLGDTFGSGKTATIKFLETGLPDLDAMPMEFQFIFTPPDFANDQTVTVDLFTVSQPALPGSTESTAAAVDRDGYPMGALDGFTVDQTGTISGIYSNGIRKNIGQVALSIFANPGGLVKAANNLYVSSNNSGLAQVGEALSGGRGRVSPANLEMSNVDISAEFTNLIVTQRGFQANSRVITASDEMLQDLVNLKR